MILFIFLLNIAFAAPLSEQIDNLVVQTSTSQELIQVEILEQNKSKSKLSIKTKRDPEVLKLESHKVGNKIFVLADYSLGYEFGSKMEKTCYQVTLWELSNYKLKKVSELNYKCVVNTSNDYLKADDFEYKYRLTKDKTHLEFY